MRTKYFETAILQALCNLYGIYMRTYLEGCEYTISNNYVCRYLCMEKDERFLFTIPYTHGLTSLHVYYEYNTLTAWTAIVTRAFGAF